MVTVLSGDYPQKLESVCCELLCWLCWWLPAFPNMEVCISKDTTTAKHYPGIYKCCQTLSLSVQQARGTEPFRKHYRMFFATLLVSQLTGSKTENIFSLARAALNRVSSSWIKGFLSRAAFLKNCFLKETLGVFWLQYWPGMWQT